MQCDRCSDTIENNEQRELNTQILCEDCYMDALSPPKGCDPWAVYLGTRTSSPSEDRGITAMQAQILDIIKNSVEIEAEMLHAKLDGQISQPDLKRELATLRHMEMVRGKPKDGKVVICLW